MGTITLIGIGSPISGDEVGFTAIEHLQPQASIQDGASVRWLTRERPGVSLIQDWSGAETVVLLDALLTPSGKPPVQRISPKALLQQAGGISSHDVGVAETLALAEAIGQLPERLLIYGIATAPNNDSDDWLDVLIHMLHEDLHGTITFPHHKQRAAESPHQ